MSARGAVGTPRSTAPSGRETIWLAFRMLAYTLVIMKAFLRMAALFLSPLAAHCVTLASVEMHSLSLHFDESNTNFFGNKYTLLFKPYSGAPLYGELMDQSQAGGRSNVLSGEYRLVEDTDPLVILVGEFKPICPPSWMPITMASTTFLKSINPSTPFKPAVISAMKSAGCR